MAHQQTWHWRTHATVQKKPLAKPVARQELSVLETAQLWTFAVDIGLTLA